MCTNKNVIGKVLLQFCCVALSQPHIRPGDGCVFGRTCVSFSVRVLSVSTAAVITRRRRRSSACNYRGAVSLITTRRVVLLLLLLLLLRDRKLPSLVAFGGVGADLCGSAHDRLMDVPCAWRSRPSPSSISSIHLLSRCLSVMRRCIKSVDSIR